MSSRGDTVQVRGRDCMFTLQNGVAAYSQSHVFASVVSRCVHLRFSSSWVSFSYGRSSLTAEAFPWPHCLQPAASFWCGLRMSSLRDCTGLLVLSSSTLVGLWFNTAAPFPLAHLYTFCLHHPYLKAAVAHPHVMDAPAITNLF